MNSKSNSSESENGSESSKRGGTLLLDRRKYLRFGAAAVGAVGTGTGAAVAASTASAERNGIGFGRVLNAGSDLGIADGDRVDEVLDDVAREGDTLVQFPPGEYLVGSPVQLRADDFGIESTTGDREDVVFKPISGTHPIMFQPDRGQSGFYAGSVTLDRRDEWDSSMTLMRGIFSDDVYVTDLLVNGWAPHGGEQLLIFSITDSNGSALVDGVTRRGPSQFPEYPSTTLTIFNGPSSKGTITYRNLEIHNATESAIYAGKSYGPIRVEDSYFKNCSHSAVRVTGDDSWIKNTTVVMDLDDLHPDAEVKDPKGIQLNRGIWIQSGDHEHNGPLVEDCDIVINSAENGIAGIMNNDDSGGMNVRNTRVECNQDDIYPVLIQAEASEKAGTPYEATLDGVSVTGSGTGRPAVEIRGRDGTTVKNSCIQMPNTDGIRFKGTSDATIEDTNVNVGGQATIFESAEVTTTNLTSDESCPAPVPDSWRNEDSNSTEETDTSDGSDSTDDSTSEPVTCGNRIVVAQTREGEVVRYELTASEGLESGEYAQEEPDGNTVSGRTGKSRGVDDFYVDGHVTAFSGSNLEYATVYFADEGVDLEVENYVLQNPEDLREADPAVLAENVLVVESDDDHASGFEFSASGEVVPGATGDGATVEDGTASGSTADSSAFHFTGSLEGVAVTDPDTVTVTVNGTVLEGDDVATIGEEEELPNSLSFVGNGEATSYEFTVSGEIAAGSSSTDDVEDNVSDSSAEGAIEDGTHVYAFSGVVTDLTVTGGIEVYRNGELMEGTDGSDGVNLIEFDGSKSNEVCSYGFSASEGVSKSEEHSTEGAGKWDSLESNADEDSVVGIVHRGVDAYWFTGSIVELELRGSAVATFRTVE